MYSPNAIQVSTADMKTLCRGIRKQPNVRSSVASVKSIPLDAFRPVTGLVICLPFFPGRGCFQLSNLMGYSSRFLFRLGFGLGVLSGLVPRIWLALSMCYG